MVGFTQPAACNESKNNQRSIVIDGDDELQISGNFENISIPFVPRNAKSLPSSPVKPHEAVPLSEYRGRAEKEEVSPEVIQSWRRETILDKNISQVAPTSGSSSIRTEIRPLARSTPIPTTPPKSQQQQPQLLTIRQEDNREEETVVPSQIQPELESSFVTWEKLKETFGIFVHDTLIPAAQWAQTAYFFFFFLNRISA